MQTMEMLQSAKEETYKEFEYFVSAIEKEELPVVQDLKESLEQFDVNELDMGTIKKFSDALDHPVNDKNGRTYVEVPNPKVMLPVLKKVVDKFAKALTKIKIIPEKVKEKAEHIRVSFKKVLSEKNKEIIEKKNYGNIKDVKKNINSERNR